jgi:hypothetical protein
VTEIPPESAWEVAHRSSDGPIQRPGIRIDDDGPHVVIGSQVTYGGFVAFGQDPPGLLGRIRKILAEIEDKEVNGDSARE